MPSLPSGTVTFLFTDIEGSTKLWENYPEQMRSALARHDELLRQAVEANHGDIVKTTGDGVMAAFHTANDALNAALIAQQAFLAEPWLEPIMIRVRMGMHTGTAEYRDGDYFGPALNRAARLMAAGYGEQVLLSNVTYDLCRDALPDNVSLLPLGEHRLKDLNRPETVYQVQHLALTATFPPLKTLDNLPNNLPQQVTSFIGREKEIREVKALLDKTHLLTLMGSGGLGKTRLSQQVAADVLDDYPDGVWLVELAPLADPALVPQTVATVLGVREQSSRTILQTLSESLKAKQLLLLLDNCEHLIAACAHLAATLLRSCQNIRILATSRERLGIAGELTYRVPSLTMPDLEHMVTPQTVNLYESVRLFVERALFHKPEFAITNHNAPALAQLCHRLDGIPLAIELAAARVRSLSVEDINGRLDSRFRLLTGGDRSALPRQQTLRALVDWSYDLLTEQEKVLLARLSVFAGGWTLEAAEAVCGLDPIEDWEVLDVLTGLLDKSLALVEEEKGDTRYRMLETIRQYGTEKLESVGAVAQVRDRHRDYFLALAEEAEPLLEGPDQAKWLTRLKTEYDNLRAALAWCIEASQSADGAAIEAGLRLSGALSWFWWVRGYLSEGREHLGQALEQGAGLRTVTVAKALNGAGLLARNQSDHAAAQSLYEESLGICRDLGNKHGIASALHGLGGTSHNQGDFTIARSQYEESLTIHRELGDKQGIASALNLLGLLACHQGDYVTARSLVEESLAVHRELGNKQGVASSLAALGHVALYQGDYTGARSLQEESLVTFRELGNKQGIGLTLGNLGTISHRQGDYVRARSRYEESLALFHSIGYKLGIAQSLTCLGHVARCQGYYDTARSRYEESLAIHRELGNNQNTASCLAGFASMALSKSEGHHAVVLWGVAHTLRESIGSPLPPNDQAEQDNQLEQALSLLGEEAFAIAFAEGRTMTWEQAVAFALDQTER